MVDIVKQMATQPDSVFSRTGLVPGDGNTGGVNAKAGSGPCGIKQSKMFNDIYKLDPDFSGRGHWFFPYGAYKAPIPVTIPFGQPDGTIAFTAPMNGCALQVNKVTNGFVFYHDPLGQSMSGSEPGDVVCRVEDKDYDKLDRGAAMVQSFRDTSYGGTYGIGVFCIHLQGRWKVYISAVAGAVDKKGQLSSAQLFNSAVTPLITSFEDPG
jgi:hypothetical protein